MTATFPCRTCDGHGHTYELASGHGGNDPWSTYRDTGTCGSCDGSGNQRCDFCCEADATERYQHRGKEVLICRSCWDEEMELRAGIAAAERTWTAQQQMAGKITPAVHDKAA